MTEGDFGIPDLERDLRDLLRLVYMSVDGDRWLSNRSGSVLRTISRTADLARLQRPGEHLQDDWAAAGLREVLTAVRSDWTLLAPFLISVWPSEAEAEADLNRLAEFRGRTFHLVGSRTGRPGPDEANAIVERVSRDAQVARRCADVNRGKTWPYLTRIYSNLEGLERSSQGERPAPLGLQTGDALWVEIWGSNPRGESTTLRYRAELLPAATSSAEWSTNQRFDFVVPDRRQVLLIVEVAQVDDYANADRWKLTLDVAAALDSSQ